MVPEYKTIMASGSFAGLMSDYCGCRIGDGGQSAMACPPRARAGRGYLTCFQYSRFSHQAKTVNTDRNSSTHTPSRVRAWALGSDM